MEFALSPAGNDATAWGLVGQGTSASALFDHIEALVPCMHQWVEEGRVDEACTRAAAGEAVDLDNGVAASALSALADGMPVSGPMLSMRAREVALEEQVLGDDSFQASHSWRKSFLQRHRLSMRVRSRSG